MAKTQRGNLDVTSDGHISGNGPAMVISSRVGL